MSSENCKLNGLSGMEAQLAYTSLLKLKKSIIYEQSKEEEGSLKEFELQVDMMLSILGSKLEGPESQSFSSVEDLTKLKITFTGFLALKPNLEDRIVMTASLGQNELWSSANLYRQLQLLESLTRASAPWIDAFFFRVSAMLPPNKRMALIMEHIVPAATIDPSSLSSLSGFVDYTAIVASHCVARNSLFPPAHLLSPQLYVLRSYMPTGFFVIEAKFFNPSDHIPLAVCDLFACGKLLQQVLRGALTNGRDWIFLLVKLNNNYEWASYQQSSMVQLPTTGSLGGQPKSSEPDLISGILAFWIENSFVDLGSDDWFKPFLN
ncbi:hypothetical protein BGW80DRAFT_1222200 [Lactifluus volemus]|nr:hypothetical protein BGW80DRAFT_1222200 [Lactifluus volemus]